MFRRLLLLPLLLPFLSLGFTASNSKVEPRLLKTLTSNNRANIIVQFGDGHRDVIRNINTLQLNNRVEKTTHLIAKLKSWSQSSQRNAVAILQHSAQFPVTFKQFWISNELYVNGANHEVIKELEGLPEVSLIREERVVQIDDESVPSNDIKVNFFDAQWNLEKVEAPKAWDLPGGNKGEGVVVANIDTGVRHTHEALRGNYRAEYGWFDAYFYTEEAQDTDGHGTHCMGSLAGAGIGVAPGATWIACQGCFAIFCGESTLKTCGEWILCPTRPNGTDPDCSKAPRVVSNSWTQGEADDFYKDVTDAWKAVDIIPVFAIGNDGPNCGTTVHPGNKDVIAVGSTTAEDNISNTSSVGPAPNNLIKPDLSAPGHLVYSALGNADDSYGLKTGTSMACPHVAGTVALLLSRNPNLNYDQVKSILEENTDQNLVDTGSLCGGINSTTFPNNQYGHGRLNSRKALEAVIRNKF